MVEPFVRILNMSIAASWLILAVVFLRLLLKKAPKWVAVLLWGIVALRLAVPVSLESVLSLIPSAETFNAHNIQYETPAVSSGIPAVNNVVNPVLGEAFAPNPTGSANPLYVWTSVLSAIWLVGIAVMLLYAVMSYIRVRRSVAERVPYEENIFLCDHVKSPFILGLVRPKIYLPSDMDDASMEPVLAHEKAHLARRDHWWKPLGFLILAVHWFNPLCWAAYVLLCRDIELACDEKVIRRMDVDGKKRYSSALLACSSGRRLVTVCPLAFGEVGVKERVKKVLHYKKPAVWIVAAAVAACVLAAVCFATDPVTKGPGATDGNDAVDGNDAAGGQDGAQPLTWDDILAMDKSELLSTLEDKGLLQSEYFANHPDAAEDFVYDFTHKIYDGTINLEYGPIISYDKSLEMWHYLVAVLEDLGLVPREAAPYDHTAADDWDGTQPLTRDVLLAMDRSELLSALEDKGLLLPEDFAANREETEILIKYFTPRIMENKHKLASLSFFSDSQFKELLINLSAVLENLEVISKS